MSSDEERKLCECWNYEAGAGKQHFNVVLKKSPPSALSARMKVQGVPTHKNAHPKRHEGIETHAHSQLILCDWP